MLSKKIIETLDDILENYNDLKSKISSPEVSENYEEYISLNKKIKSVEPTAILYNDYKNNLDSLPELELLSKESDEMEAIAKEEIKKLKLEIVDQEEKIKLSLVPKNEFDEKDVIMEIRGAVGGDEANIFAEDLFNMYKKYFDRVGFKIKVIDWNESVAGGVSTMSMEVKGKNAFQYLKHESGSHRVQRVPKTESMGRIHTSIATVAVLPKADKVEALVNMNDLRIDTYRASGAGGQHVNKTDSAIRITHIPTGIVSQSQDGRSQHDNKAKAMEILAARLLEKKMNEQMEKQSSIRSAAVGTGERSEKIRTYNYPQNRVTDHRINLTIKKLDQIMQGNLDEILDSLIANDQEERLKESGII
ncbi:MAG: peptide chain release factor 1 [Mycoplasmataceae bacterium]|nr:peptide chain release factor 1 [Mycoplasmataceae bacterium]